MFRAFLICQIHHLCGIVQKLSTKINRQTSRFSWNVFTINIIFASSFFKKILLQLFSNFWIYTSQFLVNRFFKPWRSTKISRDPHNCIFVRICALPRCQATARLRRFPCRVLYLIRCSVGTSRNLWNSSVEVACTVAGIRLYWLPAAWWSSWFITTFNASKQ